MRLPTGTVTLLFTDVEGSTRLLEAFGDHYIDALVEQRRLIEDAVRDNDGFVVDTQGDSFFCVFATGAAAVRAALVAQRALASYSWPHGCVISVRMGIHTGNPSVREGDYFGLDVHQAARIMSAAHGGQVLVSAATTESLDASFSFLDLGLHRLKDLTASQRVFQLTGEGLASTFPPVRSLNEQATNLPVQPTPLVGRLRELGELSALLARDEVRLVTVTGPGGIGKTRVASHAAAELMESFANGVWFVPLAPLHDPELIVVAIAEAIGIRERPGRALLETVIDFLDGGRTLLVLDNFEHLLEGAPTVATLLSRSRELHVLVTSRTRLRVSGEHSYAVAPLDVPTAHAATTVTSAAESPAVELFVQRARAASGTFELRPDNLDAVVDICRRLDGLPLALELAAARVATLTPAMVAARLDRRLALLTSGPRDTAERQRTLRHTIEWSYELLQPDERQLFARLSVFAGGWTFDAAESVCDAALDPFASLVDSSLTLVDGDRYRMLETIREFAGEQLGAERDDLHRRHASYYASVLHASMEHLDEEASATVTAEQDNMRAALRWAIDQGDGELAATIGVDITYFWFLQNNLTEARAWLQELTALRYGDSLRAKLLLREGAVAQSQADYAAAISANEAALALHRQLGESAEIPAALNNVAVVHMFSGQRERARDLFRECAELAEQAGDALSVASANCNLGVIAISEQDYTGAETLLVGAAEIARTAEHSYGLAACLANLGTALVGSGKLGDAAPVLEESLSLMLTLGDEAGAAGVIESIGVASAESGRADAGARLLGAADSLRSTNDYVAAPLEQELTNENERKVRDVLPPEAFDRAYREGGELALQDVTSEARSLVAELRAADGAEDAVSELLEPPVQRRA